jgi:hypothetical protein
MSTSQPSGGGNDSERTANGHRGFTQRTAICHRELSTDRLAVEGPPPISEQLKAEFVRREEAFFSDPHKGEVWESVREELFRK